MTCELFQSTTINFKTVINPLNTNRIGFCKNIISLFIIFQRSIEFNEISFLLNLTKLEKLFLFFNRERISNPIENNENNILNFPFLQILSTT